MYHLEGYLFKSLLTKTTIFGRISFLILLRDKCEKSLQRLAGNSERPRRYKNNTKHLAPLSPLFSVKLYCVKTFLPFRGFLQILSPSYFSLLSLILLFFSNLTPSPSREKPNPNFTTSRVRVLVADLPRSFNYSLLHFYWSLSSPDSRINADPDSRINVDPDSHLRSRIRFSRPSFPPYPSNPLINQYSAEYWLLGDFETPEDQRFVKYEGRGGGKVGEEEEDEREERVRIRAQSL